MGGRCALSCKTKVCDFQDSPVAHEEVRRLEVAVEDPVGVQMLHATQQLLHHRLELWAEGARVRGNQGQSDGETTTMIMKMIRTKTMKRYKGGRQR